jgi:hypothetical protein
VTRVPGFAEIADTTTGIDFADDALTYQRAIETSFNDSYKLVSDSSSKACIPARDFEISVTDTRKRDPYYRFIFFDGFIDAADSDSFLFNAEGKHRRQKALLLVYAFCELSCSVCF